MQQIDIFITAYLRPEYTQKTLEYLYTRTKYPFRVFLIDNGGNTPVAMRMQQDHAENFHWIEMHENIGIHAAWNVALALAESEYFITSDNDIYVPELVGGLNTDIGINFNKPQDWLGMMVKFMDERPTYAAISLHPHVFIGAAGIDPEDPEDVKQRNMCGAVMRIMRTNIIRQVGGWEHKIDPQRNHEERTICGKLQDFGYKVGITSRIRAYHPFGKETGGNWGYPPEITPEMQGHNPSLKDEVLRFDNPDAYDEKTWLPKS